MIYTIRMADALVLVKRGQFHARTAPVLALKLG